MSNGDIINKIDQVTISLVSLIKKKITLSIKQY